MDYIHYNYNPVKHDYIMRAVDWLYSSFHRFVKLGVYPTDWADDRLRDMKSVGME